MIASFFLVVVLCGLLFWNFLKIMQVQQEKINALMGIRLSLTSLIDLKDSYTEGHSKHVRNLARKFAEFLKLSPTEIEDISTAAELHDIGKIGVPDSILKKNGTLNEEEFLEIKKHPQRGSDALKPLKGFENVTQIIRNHHERYDGTGYPRGLSGERIPFGARVLGILDTYDAMVYNRPYRKAKTIREFLDTLEKGMGSQFDPSLAAAFHQFLLQNSEKNHKAYDPVCGMEVHPKTTAFKSLYQNQTYIFCSEICLEEFNRNPGKYVFKTMPTDTPPRSR